MISKNISIGTIDVDTDTGKLWVNCPNCILRISGINFSNIEEKFSMIDIIGTDAHMFPGELETENYGDFLEKITCMIVPKYLTLGDDKREELLNNLEKAIKELL